MKRFLQHIVQVGRPRGRVERVPHIVTDPEPTAGADLRNYAESEKYRLHLLPGEGGSLVPASLPPALPLQTLASELEQALGGGDIPQIRGTAHDILRLLCDFYGISVPSLTVLGRRPRMLSIGADWIGTTEVFGRYHPPTERIQVWLRTAVRAQVTSFGTFLNALLHEFCHHFDRQGLSLSRSPHTRGFFERSDCLYHLARGTPEAQRRPLAWVRGREAWYVDWGRQNALRLG